MDDGPENQKKERLLSIRLAPIGGSAAPRGPGQLLPGCAQGPSPLLWPSWSHGTFWGGSALAPCRTRLGHPRGSHRGGSQAGQSLATVKVRGPLPKRQVPWRWVTAPLTPHLLPSRSGGQSPVPSCWQCWEDGDRGQPPGYPTALGVAPCVPAACCVHRAAFRARNPAPGHFCLYTAGGWRWLILAGWQGCAAGSTGESGRGWLGGGRFMAVIVTAQSGRGGMDSVPAWAARPGTVVPGAALQGLLPSPAPSCGSMPGPLCHPVLCPLWMLRAAGLGGERREGGMDLDTWVLRPERLLIPCLGGHVPWL